MNRKEKIAQLMDKKTELFKKMNWKRTNTKKFYRQLERYYKHDDEYVAERVLLRKENREKLMKAIRVENLEQTHLS